MTVNAAMAEALGLPVEQRVLVRTVNADKPADRAGLRGRDDGAAAEGSGLSSSGDLIVAIDGRDVHDMDDLIVHLSQSAMGQTVMVAFLAASH